MEESTQEFSSDNLSVKTKRSPGCQVTFDVTINPKATDAAYRKAIKSINKEISLPGFRKGKAPEALVIQNYGKHVDQEWHDILVKTSFKEVLDLTNIYPLNDRSIKRPEIKNASREEGSQIIFEMEVFPDVPKVEPSELKLEEEKEKEVTEEHIETAIMDLRLHHANWEEITDRPIEEGDYIEADIDNVDNPEKPICKDTLFEVKEGIMGNWMRKLLIGKNLNDVVEGMSEKDEKDDDKAEFKPTNCRITVKKIKKPILPELNDEFAAKVGLKTIDELEIRVKEDLERQAKEAVKQNLRGQIDNLLDKTFAFDLPASVFESEKKSRLLRINEMKKQMGEEAFAKVADRYNDESINADVSRSLRIYFLTQKIVEDNKIEVTQNEISQEMMQHIYNPNSQFINPSMDANEIRSKLYLVISERKAKDFLIENSSGAKSHL